MTPDERVQILITARLLRAAEKIDWLATGFTLLAAGAIVLGTPGRHNAVFGVILGLIAKLYSVRISFDARLFEDIAAQTLTTPALDAALRALAIVPRDQGERSWLDRCRGSRRLVILCAGATIGQAVALVLIAIKS